MEDNKRRNINWYDILSKVIFLIIIILILMWFFPRGNNSNDEINNKLDTINSKLTVLVDKVFRDNLNEMKAAAKAYFTKDRMPTEDGDSVKLTLQDMYDQNMLLPLIDKDGKACSPTKSYVKVTKDGDEWKLKVSLTCSGETKYIVETIGCYDFCEDGSCEGEIATKLQYQFVREVESTKYSCPSGYTLKGKYCYSTTFGSRIAADEVWEDATTKTIDATKVEGGEIKSCVDAHETQDDPTYSCPDGYTLDGTTCTNIESTPATQGYEYTCPAGYEKNDNYCYKTTTISATPKYSYSCTSGTLSGTNCVSKTTKSATSYVSGYKCPSGYKKYTSSGSKCYKKTKNGYSSWKYVKSYATKTYSREYKGSTSWLDYLGSYKAYPCNNGKYSRKCPRKVTYYKYRYYTRGTKYKTTYKSGSKVYGKKCTGSGWSRSGNTCTKTNSTNALKTISSYSCPSGYTKSGTICIASSVVPATKVEGELSCPDGYALEGENCYKTTDVPATEIPGQIHYSCDTDWTLEGTQCCETIKTDDEYYCTNPDAVLEGDKCIITVPAYISGYKCPTGYTKKGKNCYKKVTDKTRATSKTVVSYQYKWSYFKSLYGWTRTGKTRSV